MFLEGYVAVRLFDMCMGIRDRIGEGLLTQSGVSLQVALSIQGAGEGDVVQGAWWGVAADVLGHAADTVLCLLWGQLPPQLIHGDVGLQHGPKQHRVKDKGMTEN